MKIVKLKSVFLTLALSFGIGPALFASGPFSGKLTEEAVSVVCDTVARWQIKHHHECVHKKTDWTNGALYVGMFKWAEQTGDNNIFDFLKDIGTATNWDLGRRVYHADDICVGQMYIRMYERFSDKKMLQNVLERAYYVAGHPSDAPLSKKDKVGRSTRWSWCDALFMAPPVYASLYRLTGEKCYLDYMDSEFREATDSLYDRTLHLYYRDCTRIPKREKNGARQFWSRGNGWVFAGIPLILEELPEDASSREYYETIFKEMAESVAALQDENGCWHASLMDMESYPEPENSGAGFFCYGLAWGIRTGLLEKEKYQAVLEKGWEAIVSSVDKDGKLGYVQPVGAGPGKYDAETTEVYGTGAFLMAGSEILRLVSVHDNPTVDGYRGIWFTLGQFQEYGDKYSGGLGTYTVKHIPMAVYSKEADKTFFVYGGTPEDGKLYLQCMIGCYDHKTGLLQKPRVVYDKGRFGVIDPHDNPTVQIDKDGHVWVFVAGRGNKRNGIRFRSVQPYDISSFEYVGEDIMAYPQVHYNPDKGFFLFFTRYDGVRQIFYRTSNDGRKWTDYRKIASIIEPEEKKSGHYQITACRGTKLVSAFNRHINGKVDTRTNIYVVVSEDWGQTWTTVDGTPVELPLTRRYNNALVRDYQSAGRNCYIKDVNFDKDGNPVILYLTSDNHITGPDGGERKWHTLHWTGEKWVESIFATSTHCYDSGSIWTQDKEWTVLVPSDAGPQYWGAGGEIVKWVSRNEGRSWKRAGNITSGSLYNHGYVRRPQNASDGFYAFWADGNPDKVSPSRLYFCNKQGDVFRMPEQMTSEWCAPEPVLFTR